MVLVDETEESSASSSSVPSPLNRSEELKPRKKKLVKKKKVKKKTSSTTGVVQTDLHLVDDNQLRAALRLQRAFRLRKFRVNVEQMIILNKMRRHIQVDGGFFFFLLSFFFFFFFFLPFFCVPARDCSD